MPAVRPEDARDAEGEAGGDGSDSGVDEVTGGMTVLDPGTLSFGGGVMAVALVTAVAGI